MINYSRLSPTSEETRSWQPNNKSTRGVAFNAHTAQGRSLHSTSLVPATCPSKVTSLAQVPLPQWDSASTQLAPSKGLSLAQMPLPLGLGQHSACSIQKNKPRSSASPTMGLGQHSACSIQRNKPRSSASPTMGLGQHSAFSIQRNKPRSSVSPTGTRPALSLLHPKEQASLKCLSHWDSASNQLAPSKGTSLAQVPLPQWDSASTQLVPSKGTSLAQVPLPPGLGHLATCSSKVTSLTQLFPPPTRPVNISAVKTSINKLKLLKVPVLNSASRVNYVKHNQVSEPVVSIQRKTGSKRSSKSLKNTKDTLKYGSLGPSCHSQRNSVNSLQKGHLSINTSPMLVHRAGNSGSKMISDNMAPVSTVHSSESRDESTAVSIPIAPSASISGRNMHPSPSQATRPSGLRMPSPSLAFFSQPKTSVSYSLSWRNTDSNVCGIQKLEDIRLRNTLTKIPKMANGTSASTNSNRVVSSRSECSAPFDVSAVSCGIIQSNMENASVQKVGMKVLYDVNNSEPKGNTIDVNVQIQDLKQTETGKIISQDDIELQKNDKEYCLQSASCEKVTGDNNLKTAILPCPGNRESCMSGWGNSNLISQHNCLMLDTSGPETKDATNEPHKGPKICKLSVSKHDIRSGDVNDHRWQNSLTLESNLVETCMQDWHEPPREQTDQLKFSLEETNQGPDGAKHILKTSGRANEPAKESQEYGSCYTANLDFEALESNMKSSHSASKHGHNDLSIKNATGDVMIYDLHVGGAQLQAPEDILTIESCKNSINQISVVGASNEQSGKASEVKDACHEVELDLQKNNKLHATDWLLPENQVCCIKSLQEKLTETLPVVDPVGKDGNQLFDINMEIAQAPAAVHDADFNIGKMIGQPLIRDTQFNSVENTQLSESRNILFNTSSYDGVLTANANYFELDSYPNEVTKTLVVGDGRSPGDNDLQNMGINEMKDDLFVEDPTSQHLSNSPHHETQTTKTNDSSLLSRSRVFEESQKINLEKTTDSMSMLDGYYENNSGTSAVIVKDGGFGVDKRITLSHPEDLLVQSSYDSALKEDCIKHTSTVPVKSIISDESDQTSVLSNRMDSATKPSDLYGDELIKSGVIVQKSTLMLETCKCADVIVGQSCIQDVPSNPLEVELSPDHNKSGSSQNSSTSVSELLLKLECVEDKVAISSINKFGDGCNKKSHTFVPPQDAVPFSDEWLAAIEAAGEDILTMKSGAVQNSPPDKSLPEPNPWSPVKRKANQIGPFDCTKFTNISPSDSS
ncbi:Uncharacterized protein Adt_39385 [Abeliophyllum distichum]|uniref:Uncharacterized protein n=1 Tax=Abeliophyllum distichum TaxID=126358 RepID=A0ABD1Q7Z7_9LAMI